METEDPYPETFFSNNEIVFHPITFSVIIGIVIVILLLIASALISGSEVAFFSLTPSAKNKLRGKKSKTNQFILKLLGIPEKLLATILISNNFINVAIVILSSFITNSLIDFSNAPALGFIFQVVIITFVLLLFGEIMPKIYATKRSVKFSAFMAYPLFVLEKLFRPISATLIYSGYFFNKQLTKKKQNISIDDLSDALDITSNAISEEKNILRGIVKFGNIDVKEILKPRMDVTAIEINTKFKKLISIIIESGYSRIPVYSESFDNVKGILYIKDLLPHLNQEDEFKWPSLIRPPYFVPETKKINDLLEEFQLNKIHMAIVVDEYGGTYGIVTLEDILEEIVGEITDETDEDEAFYSKIDDKVYLFEGKTSINDFNKVIKSEDITLEEIKSDADTLAGLILEIKGELPYKNEKIVYKNLSFQIESVDKRRIKQVKVIINEHPVTGNEGRK